MFIAIIFDSAMLSHNAHPRTAEGCGEASLQSTNAAFPWVKKLYHSSVIVNTGFLAETPVMGLAPVSPVLSVNTS